MFSAVLKSRLLLLAATATLCSCAVGVAADPFPPAALPGTEIGGGLPSGYEPSGAVWHSGLDRLFTVSDNGLVTRMDRDGSDVFNWSVPGDLEGITVADASSDFVYIGVEGPDSILEFDLTTGLVTRTFDLTPWMTGPSNRGLEALTFVPDADDPEGGLFYAGLQDDGRIYTFQLPIISSTTATTVTPVSTIVPVSGRDDISGLHYDPQEEVLFAAFDSSNRLRAMESDGTFLQEWDLVGNDQEGIAFAGRDLFVAEDVGKEVWRYTLCAMGDANCDGFVDISNDILTAFSNFSGPGSFDRTRAEGDVHGDIVGATTGLDLHDGDVDVSDILAMFTNFTGPPSDQTGLAAGDSLMAPAATGDPSVPDLIYNPTTGEVILDPDGAGIIGYSLKNGTNSFHGASHTPVLGGVSTSLSSELAEAALSSLGSPQSIGFVLPIGLDLAGLHALFTTNEVSRALGAPLVPFDLVVLTAVPEPTASWLAACGLLALGGMVLRRRAGLLLPLFGSEQQ